MAYQKLVGGTFGWLYGRYLLTPREKTGVAWCGYLRLNRPSGG